MLRLLPARAIVAWVDQRASDRDMSPLSTPERLLYAGLYFAGALVFTVPLFVAQHALLVAAGQESSSFSHRVTDLLAYSFLPAFFLALVTFFPIYLRVLRWYLGERLLDVLEPAEGGRYYWMSSMSLSQQIGIFPRLTWAIAILATVLNCVAFDTFLQITASEFRYSTFFSPRTHRHSLGEVRELVVRSRRDTPRGVIVDRRSLEVRLRDGRSVDTFDLIEAEHVLPVVAAFQSSPEFKGRVTWVNASR
jgi:hypothetical protein